MSDRTTNAVGLYDAALNLRSRFIAETIAFLARYWNDPLARLPMKDPPAAAAVTAEPLVVRLMEDAEVIPPPADVIDDGPFPHLVFAHVGEPHGPDIDVAPVDASGRPPGARSGRPSPGGNDPGASQGFGSGLSHQARRKTSVCTRHIPFLRARM